VNFPWIKKCPQASYPAPSLVSVSLPFIAKLLTVIYAFTLTFLCMTQFSQANIIMIFVWFTLDLTSHHSCLKSWIQLTGCCYSVL
jgi:hypothetical protein